MADLVGSVVVARYRVISKVASGASADVYEAEHVSLGSHVALKVLANNDASSEVAARFLREGKTLGMFRHPNIVELLEVGRLEGGALFLATELVHGQSLRQLGAVEPRRALAIVRDVLDALGHAHGMGVIHRGMRPENVMITDDGRVKVLDFGVAKLASDTAAVLGENKLTRTGIAVLGDPRYSAPEVARGGEIDARADLYAVGKMLEELIPSPSTPQLQLLISEATQSNPDLRYRNAAEMRSAVDTAIASLDEASGVVVAQSSSTVSTGWSLESGPTTAASPVLERQLGSAPMVMPASPSVISNEPLFTSTPSMPVAPTTHSGPWKGEANLTASERSRPPVSIAANRPRRDYLALARQHKRILAIAGGALVLVIILIVALSGGKKSGKKGGGSEDARTLLKHGHDEFTAGHKADALGFYERAIAADSSLAGNPEVRQNAAAIVDGKDPVAAVIALELIASRLSPRGKDVIVATAANGKLADVRRRALAIAQRDGYADQIDQVASRSLDLAQAQTCEDRRAVIGKLRATADKRALAPLKKAKVYKCVEKDATDAIAELEAKP